MEYILRKGEVISFVASAGNQTLRMAGGSVWITRGDARDYILSQRDRLLIHHDETVVLEALQDASFSLTVADAHQPRLVVRFSTVVPHKV